MSILRLLRSVNWQSVGLSLLVYSCLALTFGMSQKDVGLKGIIKDSLGEPIRNATVVLHSSSSVRLTKSQAQGQFTFSSLPSGQYGLDVIAQGFVDQSVNAISVPDENQPITVALKVAPLLYECTRNRPSYVEVSGAEGSSLAGQVWHDRSPLAGARVLLFAAGNPQTIASQQSSKDGTFEFPDLAPEKYVIQVSHKPFEAYTSEQVWIAPGILTKVAVNLSLKGSVTVCQ